MGGAAVGVGLVVELWSFSNNASHVWTVMELCGDGVGVVLEWCRLVLGGNIKTSGGENLYRQ